MYLGPRKALLRPPAIVAAPLGYTGPGDITAGASHWYGTYAYSDAIAAALTPCLTLTDQADANETTFNLTADGIVNVEAIEDWVALHTVTTILIKQVHDQIGTAHLTAAGPTARPELMLASLGSIPGMYSAGGIIGMTASITSTPAPYTLVGVAKRHTVGAHSIAFGEGGASGAVLFGTSSGTITVYGGGGAEPIIGSSITENAFHSIQAFFDEPDNEGAVDGVSTSSATAGDATLGSLALFSGAFPGVLTVLGFGLYPSDKRASFAALSANDHTRLGF